MQERLHRADTYNQQKRNAPQHLHIRKLLKEVTKAFG
jgi:hypothetical protein